MYKCGFQIITHKNPTFRKISLVYFSQNQGSQNYSAHKAFYSKLCCRITVIQKYKQILYSLHIWKIFPFSETPGLAN